MTKRERQACFQHAKKHVLEAIKEAIADEHHSIMTTNGKERRDLQLVTEYDMEKFLRKIRGMKFETELPFYTL